MSTAVGVPACYTDFGPATHKPKGHGVLVRTQWAHRPYCELCGPFRGRHLRKASRDEFGTLWRCLGCDEELR